MDKGKTLFAQLMNFLPWSTFTRLVALRWGSPGSHAHLRRAVSSHGFRPTHVSREPARHRDRPVGASRQALPHGVSREGRALDVIAKRCSTSTADANETRDWRIYAEFAQRLIAQARALPT